MNFLDINNENKKVVLLIHPISFTPQGMKEMVADQMSKDYRYIIPELSSHGDSTEIFESAESEAEKIAELLIRNNIVEMDLAFAASLGGALLLHLLNDKRIKIKKCVFEGCSLTQKARFLEMIARKTILVYHKRSKVDRNYPLHLIAEKTGEELAEIIADTFIGLDDESIKNIIRSCAFVNVPNLSHEDQEKCIFCYGSEDNNLIHAKKFIKKRLPGSKLKIWEGYNHCEKIAKDNEAYGRFLENEI